MTPLNRTRFDGIRSDLLCAVAACAALLAAGCSLSLGEEHYRPESTDASDADATADPDVSTDPGVDPGVDTVEDVETGDPDDAGDVDAADVDMSVCGDGEVTGDEQCEPGDGGAGEICSATCRWVVPGICLPCETDDDCGGAEDRCLTFGERSFCSAACGSGGVVCPNTTTCTDVPDTGEFCVHPNVTACGATCIDSDGDGAGIGPCDSWDCDDSAEGIGPDATEICDGLDNDCDGEVDEDSNEPICGGADAQCTADGCRVEIDGWSHIVAGSFDIGSSAVANEMPSHPVEITYDFLMMNTEMTSSAFEAIFSESTAPSHHDVSDCGTCPVENVSFASALEAANELSRAEGLTPCYTLLQCDDETNAGAGDLACLRLALATDLTCDGYRIPTEAEWEYVARTGTGGEAPFAADLPDDCRDLGLSVFGWYCGNAVAMAGESGTIATELPSGAGGPGLVRTRPVVPVSLTANDWGVLGMYGNVSEWTWDIDGVYQATIQFDPTGPPATVGGGETDLRIVRGCAVTNTADECRVSRRAPTSPTLQDPTIGFRLVRTLGPFE